MEKGVGTGLRRDGYRVEEGWVQGGGGMGVGWRRVWVEEVRWRSGMEEWDEVEEGQVEAMISKCVLVCVCECVILCVCAYICLYMYVKACQALWYCEGPGGVLGKVVNIPHEVVLVTHVLSLGLPTSSERLTQEGYTEGGGREER